VPVEDCYSIAFDVVSAREAAATMATAWPHILGMIGNANHNHAEQPWVPSFHSDSLCELHIISKLTEECSNVHQSSSSPE
jgi:hypothetical protein